MTPQEFRETLLGTWLFNEFTAEESLALQKHAQVASVASGQALCQKDKKKPGIAIVISGQFGVMDPKSTQPKIVAKIKEGDLLGEMSWIDGQPASADVIASETARVIVIPYPEFDSFLGAHTDAHIQILRKIAVNFTHRLRGNK